MKLSDLQTLEQFVEFVYANKGKKPKLPLQKKLKTKISVGKGLDQETRTQLSELIKDDGSLLVHRHLLITSRDMEDWRAEEDIRLIVVGALKDHFLFVGEKFQELFEGALVRGSVPFVDSDVLSEIEDEIEKCSVEKSEEFLSSAKEKDVLQENAIYCLALLCRFSAGIDEASRLPTFCKEVYAALWAPRARKINGDAAKIDALVDGKPGALGIACQEFYEEAERVREIAHRIQGQEKIVREKNDDLTKNIEEITNRLKRSEDELDKIKLLMDGAEREYTLQLTEKDKFHREKISISNSKLAQLQARVRTRLNEDIALLEDGLHAVRKDPPRINVIDDHVDRVKKALTEEVKRIDQEE